MADLHYSKNLLTLFVHIIVLVAMVCLCLISATEQKEGNIIFTNSEVNDSVESNAIMLSVSETTSGFERVVTDLVFLEIGIHIDFSYNQTDNQDGLPVSAPGCPKATQGRPWVYYGTPPKCVIVGFRGLCPWGQRIFQLDNSNYGVCNCDCFAIKQATLVNSPLQNHSVTLNFNNIDLVHNLILQRKKRDDFEKQVKSHSSHKRCNKRRNPVTSVPPPPLFLSSSSSKRYQFCFSPAHDRQVVYDSLHKTCYPFLDQGPCQRGEWLVRDMEEDDSILCEKRKCPQFMGRSGIVEHPGESFTYFDYKRQECFAELLGPHAESFHHAGTGIVRSRSQICREAGMKYSYILKTCIQDFSSTIDFRVIG